MTQIALFHSVLGMRPGIVEAADRLRGQGHQVLAIDQYDGRVFDDYQQADIYAQQLGGYPELMRTALTAVEVLDDGFLCVGFSNGGGLAEHVALHRSVAGAIMCSGALPLDMIGSLTWPGRTPAQIHYTVGDPRRPRGWAEKLAASITAVGGEVDFFEYPGNGHLFTDESLPQEYDLDSSDLLWQRVLRFCKEHG